MINDTRTSSKLLCWQNFTRRSANRLAWWGGEGQFLIAVRQDAFRPVSHDSAERNGEGCRLPLPVTRFPPNATFVSDIRRVHLISHTCRRARQLCYSALNNFRVSRYENRRKKNISFSVTKSIRRPQTDVTITRGPYVAVKNKTKYRPTTNKRVIDVVLEQKVHTRKRTSSSDEDILRARQTAR